MLTKEECIKALQKIEEGFGCDMAYYDLHIERDTLEQLINEHFDNPPLTLDEIKTSLGTPIWDNWDRIWMAVFFKYGSFDELEFYSIGNEVEQEFEFEENRFYRRKVEE